MFDSRDAQSPFSARLPAWPLLIQGLLAIGAVFGVALVARGGLGTAIVAAVAIALLSLALIAFAGARTSRSARTVATPSAIATPPFALMLEHIADPLLLIAAGAQGDLSGRRYVFANAAARELLRLQRPEGLLTTAVRTPEILAAVEGALFGTRPTYASYQPRSVQERYWRVTVKPIAGALPNGGAGALALVCWTDETELRRGERTRADFLANASHELRTPLASLTGFIETLRGHARDDDDARERFLGIMYAQAERMRGLIDDLMSLSRIELNEHIAPAGEVDLSAVVVEVVDALAPIAAERRVSLAHSLPAAGDGMAIADRDQILQVAQNLVENALKYTPAGETVAIEVLVNLPAMAATASLSPTMAHLSLLTPDHASGRRYVALRVRDVGPGIARNNLPRLTERFYRVEGQKARDRPGTGLGLAIVKHIVNRHRGGLTVDSAEGVGSIFTAYFPMATAATFGETGSAEPGETRLDGPGGFTPKPAT